MRFSPRTASPVPALALFLAVLLLPGPVRLPERDLSRDLDALRQTECEYRGITTTFAELTRTYVLETYTESELLRWDVGPSSRNPDTESLVTAVFRVGRARPVHDPVVPDSIIALREEGIPEVRVGWRYSSRASVRVDAANAFGRDALAVFRLTVDGFITAMVVATSDVHLHADPSREAPSVGEAGTHTVLLLTPLPAGAYEEPAWSYVRIPSTTTRGWVETDRLIAVEDEY